MFRQNGLTAAVLTHVIDPHFISMLEYKEQEKLKFLRIDSDLGSALKTEQTEEEKQQQEEQDKQLIERFKQALPEEKLEYQVESLKSDETPAVILLSEYARRIQDMSRAFGESFGGLRTGNFGAQPRELDHPLTGDAAGRQARTGLQAGV